MTITRLLARSLVHHRRMHAGLALGALLASAILTGALIVGDSARTSLRSIASARLGRVVCAMDWGTRAFQDDLAEKTGTQAVLRLSGTASATRGGSAATQVNRAQILGVDNAFWKLADTTPQGPELGPQEAYVNEKTARVLGVKAGDDVTLRFTKPSALPMDAPLSSRESGETVSVLVSVRGVLGDGQLGKFGLAANQVTPHNVFVSRKWLQERVEREGCSNMLLADQPAAEVAARLADAWQLEQVGLRTRTVAGWVQLESSSIFLEETIVRAASGLPGARPVSTYLVNRIAKGETFTPYSFVVAGASVADEPASGEVTINQWLADHLHAAPGDSIDLAYYEVQANNALVEKHRAFVVRRVVPMDALQSERELAPEFPGLSNVEDCQNWSIGMPMDEALLKDPANEAYWKQFRQTPKLLLSYADAKAMWGGRFGAATAVRFSGVSEQQVRDSLRAALSAADVGLRMTPVREQAAKAVSQATDLGGLVLGLSFFLIVSALTLLGLLYAFGLQQRAGEMGLLLALGFSRLQVRRLFLLEALPSAAVGSLLGCGAGILYASGLLDLLTRLWPETMAGAESLRLYLHPGTLAAGAGLSFICAVLVVLGGAWRSVRLSATALLSTDFAAPPLKASAKRRRWQVAWPTGALLGAVGLTVSTVRAPSVQMAEPFFGIGALLLVGLLGFYAAGLAHLACRPSFRKPNPWKMAVTNLARRRGRSLSVAGVTACGYFLVFAVCAMQGNAGFNAGRRDSGTGGFAVYADTTMPLAGTPEDLARELGAPGIAIRVRDGDDAGCLNLNRAQAPRLLGVNVRELSERGAFSAETWALLNASLANGEIPALAGDQDTAMWGLQKKTGPIVGDTLIIQDEAGREVRLKLVGALPMRLSVFQGSVLVSDEAFTRLYPSEAGFRAFLLDGPEKPEDTAARLNKAFGRYGMQAVSAVQRLREFKGLETAYLGMFLILGGLGLLLGVGGTGVVILRNLFERRSEFALLSALGYPVQTVRSVALVEQMALAVAGMLSGIIAALFALVPVVVAGQSTASVSTLVVLQTGLVVMTAAAILGFVRAGLRGAAPEALRKE